MKKLFQLMALGQWAAILFFLMNSGVLIAQSTSSIFLTDVQSATPVAGVSFQYGNESGISDTRGIITITYKDKVSLRLTHIAYETIELNSADVLSAIKAGTITMEAKLVDLYPFTVVSLRPKTGGQESVKLDYEDKMAHDGAAILSRIPAIGAIRKSGTYGFDPVLRGFKYDQLNIVLDGTQCAAAACPNRMDPPTSQMAPNMLDRIEILKGPHALRFGSAYGGTINFIAAQPRFSDRRDVYGRWSGGYESNGNVMRTEALIGLSNKRIDWGMFGSLSQGDDYKTGSGATVQSDFMRGSIGSELAYKYSKNQRFNLSAVRNIARNSDFPALPMDLIKDDTWLVKAGHEIKFLSGTLNSWNTALFGTFVDHLMNNSIKVLNPRPMNTETFAQTRSYGGRTEGLWLAQKSKLYAGADVRIEEANGTRERAFLTGPNAGKVLYDNVWQHGRISKSGLFAEYHLFKNTLQWVLSGRMEVNQATALDPTQEFIAVNTSTEITQINPAFSAGLVKQFTQRISAGLWAARAQRSGSLSERYINFFPVGKDPYELVGNPEIKPEINHQADVTLSYKVSGSTAIHVDLFAAWLQNNIIAAIDTSLRPRIASSPGVRRYTNIDRAFKTGVEANWNQKLFAGMEHQLSMAYTYGQDLAADEPLPEIAPLDIRYALSGTYWNNRLSPEVSLRHVTAQKRISTEFGESTTPSFSLIDASLSWKVNRFWKISAGVQNIFDKNYYEHLNRPIPGTPPVPIYAPGRSFFCSMSLNFI